MEVVPQVSLELHLRGNPPALETIKYSNSANRSDVASGLQQRSLNKAVATALTLFAAHSSCQRLILFRIHYQETKPSFVRAILSAPLVRNWSALNTTGVLESVSIEG